MGFFICLFLKLEQLVNTNRNGIKNKFFGVIFREEHIHAKLASTFICAFHFNKSKQLSRVFCLNLLPLLNMLILFKKISVCCHVYVIK